MKKFILLFAIFFLFFVQTCFAQQIIINSRDWRDVYSASLFGSLTGVETSFLVSDRHATLILPAIPLTRQVNIFSSRRNMFVVGYESMVRTRGYNVAERVFDNFNLELGEDLEEITSFIIIDDSYGYNAISVAPYAIASNSWVLFADRGNIRLVESFLSDKTVDSLILYGHIDREVRTRLERYEPEIINIDGDRFLNNIEITKRYQEIRNSKQTVLTNGEFIEKEIMSGLQPVIFIGSNNVPDPVREYIQGSEIDIGVLIGNELVGTATNIRREVGISVFVKFAQGARAPQGSISQVEALDMFYLPTYILNIVIESIRYNIATGMLEITLRNTEDQAVFFKGTYTITDSQGNVFPTVGDYDSIFLDGNEIRTITYEIDGIPEGDIIANFYIIYGESKRSLEKVLDGTFDVETIEVLDQCEIKINNIFYDTRRRAFTIEIENTARVTCYADVELIDVVIDGQITTISSDIIEIRPGRKADAIIRTRLFEEDLFDNEEIRGRVYYGERRNNLIKFKDFMMALQTKGIDLWTFTLIPIIVILIILIIWKRRKKKQEEEKHKTHYKH